MKEVNYILHLNGVLRNFSRDDRITASHRSLYLAFFELWNQKHFPKIFMVNRRQVMSLAKIRSRTTYHKLLRELKMWGFLHYRPSSSAQIGTLVELFRFDKLPDQKMNRTSSISEHVPVQKMVSFNKRNNKHIINSFKPSCPENEQVVITYFKSEKRSKLEAKSFYFFYESIGWKFNGKNPITNWKACARNWMKKADEIKNDRKADSPSHNCENFHSPSSKNYEEPL